MSAGRLNLSVLRDDVRAIDAYAVPSAVGLIKLDAMENPYPLPPGLMQQLGNRLGRTPLNRYPLSDPKGFKDRLARAMGVPEGMQVMLGNGSDELIHLVIQACARPDAVVLAPWPGFVMYELSARFNRCRFVGVPLKADFSLDATALMAAIEEHKPAVVFIAHPNNPTSNLFERAVVEEVIRTAPGLVVVDEAYLPFAQDTWMPQGHPDWIVQFDKVRPPYNVNVLTLAAAELMLENLSILDAQAATLRAERTRLASALADIPGVVAFPSAANFILFRVEKADRVFAALKERGILIKNVSHMHALLDGCLRVTVGTAAENQAFIKALRAVIGTPQ